MGLRFDQWAQGPGLGTAIETYESSIRWGQYGQGIIVSIQIDGTARDSGNTPTTVLRPGLLLGPITANNNRLRDYGDNNTDGSNTAVAVLLEPVRMQDFDGNNQNKFYYGLVGGPVQAAKVLGLTEQSRGQMAYRFLFDDRNFIPNMLGWPNVVAKTANYTVVNGTDNNTLFTTTGNAGAITFTLPATITKGQKWRFYNVVGQNMAITAPANKFVLFNNATATTATFSTAGQLIGSCLEVMVDDAATKYLGFNLSAQNNTITVS